MKALLVLIAAASTAFVGYSYSVSDGETCLVCPMTGEPLLTSTETEAGSCCPGCASGTAGDEAMLTSIEGEASASCSQAKGACCSKGDAAMLTSVSDAECHGNCEKACCKDKEVAASEAEIVTESIEDKEEVAAVVAETE